MNKAAQRPLVDFKNGQLNIPRLKHVEAIVLISHHSFTIADHYSLRRCPCRPAHHAQQVKEALCTALGADPESCELRMRSPVPWVPDLDVQWLGYVGIWDFWDRT